MTPATAEMQEAVISHLREALAAIEKWVREEPTGVTTQQLRVSLLRLLKGCLTHWETWLRGQSTHP